MEIKKSPKADLEKKKQIFILMGYVFILAIIFIEFEWSTRDVSKVTTHGESDVFAKEEIISITRKDNAPRPPLPTHIADQINMVENTREVEQVNIKSSEDNRNNKVDDVFKAPVQQEEIAEEHTIFTIVEQMPEFPGGEVDLMSFIAKSVRYPAIALENSIQGRVICSFVVTKDGKVTDAEIVRGVDPSLDKEALRVINSMPIWKPGKQRGKPVRVKYTLPVSFRLL